MFVSTSPMIYHTACVWQQAPKESAGWQFQLFAAKTDGFSRPKSPLSLDFLVVLVCTCGYIMVEAAYQKQLPMRMGLTHRFCHHGCVGLCMYLRVEGL